MSGISNLVAAQLSQAAYAAFSSFTNGNTQYRDSFNNLVSLPTGWSADLTF